MNVETILSQIELIKQERKTLEEEEARLKKQLKSASKRERVNLEKHGGIREVLTVIRAGFLIQNKPKRIKVNDSSFMEIERGNVRKISDNEHIMNFIQDNCDFNGLLFDDKFLITANLQEKENTVDITITGRVYKLVL